LGCSDPIKAHLFYLDDANSATTRFQKQPIQWPITLTKRGTTPGGEYYLEKGKESGPFGSIARGKLSFFDDLPKKYASYKAALKGNVEQFNYGNFILIPVGTNKVKCIHSCFLFSELEEDPLQVVGILGSRRTSSPSNP
jgi:hypothetical protein